MPLSKKYSVGLVLSVINDAGLPSDADERAASILESLEYANELGIENEDIWIDPVLLPVGVDQRQVLSYMEFIQMIPDLAPGAKSVLHCPKGTQGSTQSHVPGHYRTVRPGCGHCKWFRRGTHTAEQRRNAGDR